MRLFLTGGTGLVGSHVAERLRARGGDVVALVRPTSDARHLRSIGARLHGGDLADPVDRLAAGMRGCDAVVHAAALVFRAEPSAAFRRANVEGTERILRAAEEADVRRVVHVSSIAVYGGELSRYPEESWTRTRVPERAVYARSKREAEEAAWRLHREGRVALTTVRPGLIYGERDRAFTPILARICRWPVVPLPGGGRATVAVVYAGSVAEGILMALEHPRSVGRAYNMSADADLGGRELVAGFARALGERPRLLSLPAAPLLLAARLADSVLGMVPGPVAEPRVGRALRRVARPNPFDDSRARRELGWAAVLEPAESLRRTALWLLEREGEMERGSEGGE